MNIRRRAWQALLLSSLALSLTILHCSNGDRPKLLVIGLDGATWDLLDPWMEQGHLPTLKALRDQSAYGTMSSVIPYLSPPAWTSAVTGVNPGRHGIFDFQRRLPGADKVVSETSKSRVSPPIWNMLRGRGLHLGVINVPMTDPPDDIDGVMVAGFPHLDEENPSRYTDPPELETEIEAAGYRIDNMGMKLIEGSEDSTFQDLLSTEEERFELVRKLYSDQGFDLFWVVFTGTDRVQHLFWQFDDPANPRYTAEKAARHGGSMLKFWMRTDELLGDFLATVPPETWILVVSDHGFGPIHRELRVGNYVRDPCCGFTEDEAQDVFSLDRSDGARLYVREPGRDPGGKRNRSQIRELRDKLQHSLETATDLETGAKVLEAVYPQESVFVGKHAERGPAVVLLPEPNYYVSYGDVEEGFQLPPFGDIRTSLSGWHHMDGIFLLRGPDVRAGKVEKRYNLLDVVPTCLYVLQQEMAEDLEGTIMESCFSPKFLEKNPPKVKGFLNEESRPMTPEEISKLKNLPYIK